MLTGTNNDTISRNIKKDAAVKHPIRRAVSAFTIFVSNILEENYLKIVEENSKMSMFVRNCHVIYHL
jgi:hypothetical protein